MMNRALRIWLEEFRQAPDESFDRLVRGLVPLGALSQMSLAEVFDLAFGHEDQELDRVLAEWVERQILGPIPEGMIPTRWAATLDELFRAMATLAAPKAGVVLRKHYSRIRSWLGGLYEGPDRDPEESYLVALACNQVNRTFSRLWRRLILGDEMPERSWRHIGLFGFRKMPDAAGRPAADLPEGMLQAIVELAERPGVSRVEWQRIVRSMFAAYRSGEDYWVRRFRATIAAVAGESGHAASWLEALLPQWSKKSGPGTAPQPLRSVGPIPIEESTGWVSRVVENPSLCRSKEFNAFLDRHRAYVEETGDSESLVKTLNNLASQVRDVVGASTGWAVELIEEARQWEPYNPFNWTVYAQTLSKAGRLDAAIETLWQARHRFPWNEFVRTQLSLCLADADDLETAAAVLREAACHFPENLACRTSLGQISIKLGDIEGAARSFEDALTIDPTNHYAQSGLAEAWFLESARDSDVALRERSRILFEAAAEGGSTFARDILDNYCERWDRAQMEATAKHLSSEVEVGAIVRANPLACRTAEEMRSAERLGRAMISLWRMERAGAGEERDRLEADATELLGVSDEQAGELLVGFVETRGLVLIASGKVAAARDYFTEQVNRYGRGAWLGIRLGLERVEMLLGIPWEASPTEERFESQSARFALHVARVIRLLVRGEDEESVAEMLRELYPMAAALAERRSQDKSRTVGEGPTRMIATFLRRQWFDAAEIRASEDFDSPESLRRLFEKIREAQVQTFDILSNAATAQAA